MKIQPDKTRRNQGNKFILDSPSPKRVMHVRKLVTDWNIYRTRFLVRAKQLTEALVFRDVLGREHCGQVGDYLVESCDGVRSIVPRRIFEDVYVTMGSGVEAWTSAWQKSPVPDFKRGNLPRVKASA